MNKVSKILLGIGIILLSISLFLYVYYYMEDIYSSKMVNKTMNELINNIDIKSFPFENDSCLRMKISDVAVQGNNYLLMDGYNLMKGKGNTK